MRILIKCIIYEFIYMIIYGKILNWLFKIRNHMLTIYACSHVYDIERLSREFIKYTLLKLDGDSFRNR
jgi:hypothetical protein